MLNTKNLGKILKNQLKNISWFSKRKGLQQNLKLKETKNNSHDQNQQSPPPGDLVELSNMKILNVQFFPIGILITPTLLNLEQMFDPSFLLGELLVQKYASLALLMNLDFQSSKAKTVFILTSMALFHSLTGYYSLITPMGMAFLSILSPFKFCNEKEKYTDIESIRMKTMTNIRMIYFFVFVLLTTVKAFHYQSIYSIEKKLNDYNSQNFGTPIEKEIL